MDGFFVILYVIVQDNKVFFYSSYQFLFYDYVYLDMVGVFVGKMNYIIFSDGIYVVMLMLVIYNDFVYVFFINLKFKILWYMIVKMFVWSINFYIFIMRFNESEVIFNIFYVENEIYLLSEIFIVVFKYFSIDGLFMIQNYYLFFSLINNICIYYMYVIWGGFVFFFSWIFVIK